MCATLHQRTQSQLPLILREEAFGGIVFDPVDATMLELDHGAFDVATKMVAGARFHFQPRKRKMLETLAGELHLTGSRDFKLIRAGKDTALNHPGLPVLNAPTLVDFQITSRCEMGCPHCYADAAENGKDADWQDMKHVVDQASACGVCQLAVGGGEPLLHPRIIDLLAYCHEKGIVPNLTTSGLAFDAARLHALKQYCGAVGVSMEGVGEHYSTVRGQPFSHFETSLQLLRDFAIPTVIQIVVSAANIDHLEAMTDFCLEQSYLYGVIFLAYKPVGRGRVFTQPLASVDAEIVTEKLSTAFSRLSGVMRVGYDCCMAPAVAGVEAKRAVVDHTSLEGCSGMRGSIGVSTDLDVLPCTFLTDVKIGNLKKDSLSAIWRSNHAVAFRQSILDHAESQPHCVTCSRLDCCRAGCPVMHLVNCTQQR